MNDFILEKIFGACKHGLYIDEKYTARRKSLPVMVFSLFLTIFLHYMLTTVWGRATLNLVADKATRGHDMGKTTIDIEGTKAIIEVASAAIIGLGYTLTIGMVVVYARDYHEAMAALFARVAL